MAVSVELGEDTLEIRARDLVQYDETEAHFSVPYDLIRTVRAGAYTPPTGAFSLGNREMAYGDVRAGHFRHGDAWTFVAYDDPERTLVLDLEDFDFALRPYSRMVLGVADPEGLRERLRRRMGSDGGAPDRAGDPEIAWTALTAGMPVIASDGASLGTVTHPLGDLDKDVFEGIAFRAGRRGAPRMARPEQIARITAGAVRLHLTAEEAETLGPVALEDLREVAPGRGIFRRGPGWKRESGWDDTRH